MIEYEIESVDQFHKFFRGYRSHDGFGAWFRGQADSEWALLPKAGREDYLLPHNRDLGRFREWLSTALAYETLPDDFLESLALSQHHGLATRLLDWSKNPLVAAFFAVSENSEKNGALYILECPDDFFVPGLDVEELSNYDGVRGYIPRAITGRILNQQALFTVHCPPERGIEVCGSRINNSEPNLRRMVIPASLKGEILDMLNDYGIAENTIYPSLDGLSDAVNRKTKRISQRARNRLGETAHGQANVSVSGLSELS
ncbi:FRG domain-containing protein [Microbulbifer magnicolonia]|uniref:FRG domain-containing protein n=1 Tax=Microbulbifer magnicolonia TaxID=3109744 RepID=UPI002B41598B|nr:FRG domain-containing protein [Microbulbifer sp. GG15]